MLFSAGDKGWEMMVAACNNFCITREAGLLKISFHSTMENIDRADQESRIFLKNNGLQSEIFSVCLCMREGLTNAVRHGHKNDPSKIVKYSLARTGNRLIMEIEDEGDGFDWKRVRKRKPAFESDHGRGLMIIQNYFSTYLFNEKGNKLTLEKVLPS
ncbi:MAG: ATP-binding protein [Desulfobacteraceae bacterium]|nr:MAG: ATP-binding protein [Desulfobacteraceae bacterium]